MYVIKTNNLHQRINNGVNYKTHGAQLLCLTCSANGTLCRKALLCGIAEIKTHQQTELPGAKFAH